MSFINEFLRIARAEAEAKNARKNSDEQQAAIDYNIMMGRLDEPMQEEEQKGAYDGTL